jgi:hypothetical protein
VTIKTFNNSENKSDQESIVLERGFKNHGFEQLSPKKLIRGSMKDASKEPFSEPIRRNCSSFGGDEFHDEHYRRDKHKMWCGSAIEEDTYSERDN